MKRRIIKQGNNTLTITLPIKWVRKKGIKSGDEIAVDEINNNLILSKSSITKEEKSTIIDISRMDIPVIWKYFMGAYREGYDEIIVKFPQGLKLQNMFKYLERSANSTFFGKDSDKKNIHERLQSMVSRFIGFEIIEHGRDYCKVREMGEPTKKEFDNSLRRVFLFTEQMSEEMLEAVQTNNSEILKQMNDIDINVDKFVDYCIRILNKMEFLDKKVTVLISTMFLTELLADEFKHAAADIIRMKIKSMKNLISMVEVVHRQIKDYTRLFYKFDFEIIKRLNEDDLKLRGAETIPQMYKNATEAEIEIFTHLRRISRYVNALVELRIEMEF